MQIRSVFFTVLLVLLSGCATTMSQEASKIQIISIQDAKELHFIANVQGSSTLTGMARKTGYQNALNEVLENAAELGAKYVVLAPNSGPAYWVTSQEIMAAAYK